MTERKCIEIIGVPPGPAPLEVREAWVGCRMPLATSSEPGGIFMILQKMKDGWTSSDNAKGYVVRTQDALIALDSMNTTAAEMAYGFWVDVFGPSDRGKSRDEFLRFSQKVCREIDCDKLRKFPY